MYVPRGKVLVWYFRFVYLFVCIGTKHIYTQCHVIDVVFSCIIHSTNNNHYDQSLYACTHDKVIYNVLNFTSNVYMHIMRINTNKIIYIKHHHHKI